MVVAWKVEWIESEAGWGQKLDDTTWYTSKKEAQGAIDKHWKEEHKRNPSGKTPSWYIRPEGPYKVEMPDEIAFESYLKK